MPDKITPVVNPTDGGLPVKDFEPQETIKMPNVGMYPVEVTVNGRKYSYYARPGDEVVVPSSVARVLANVKRPKPAEDGWKDAWATLRDCGESGGGSEPTYETVAEIEVGTMAKQEGVYGISIRLDKSIFDTSLKYYFNSADTPLEIVITEDEIAGLTYNFSAGGEILGTPAYAIELGDDDTAGLVSSEDLSNTTVRILKKVEQGGGDIPENLKPTYEFDFTVTAGESEGALVVTPDSGATYTAISAALTETPNVYANIDFAPLGLTIRARFDIDIPGDPENALTANTFVWGGSKWTGARLSVVSDGTYGVEIHET